MSQTFVWSHVVFNMIKRGVFFCVTFNLSMSLTVIRPLVLRSLHPKTETTTAHPTAQLTSQGGHHGELLASSRHCGDGSSEPSLSSPFPQSIGQQTTFQWPFILWEHLSTAVFAVQLADCPPNIVRTCLGLALASLRSISSTAAGSPTVVTARYVSCLCSTDLPVVYCSVQ